MGVPKDFFSNLFDKKIDVTVMGVSVKIGLKRIGKNLDFAQQALDNQVWADMQQYMPIDSSNLIQQTDILNKSVHGEVYAFDPKVSYGHYQWEGVMYEDPDYHIGAFYDPDFGFWSRPDVTKVATDRKLEYKNPSAVDHWDQVALQNHHTDWVQVAKNAFKRGG